MTDIRMCQYVYYVIARFAVNRRTVAIYTYLIDYYITLPVASFLVMTLVRLFYSPVIPVLRRQINSGGNPGNFPKGLFFLT